MKNKEHEMVYNDRKTISTKSQTLKNQIDKLESLTKIFKERNKKLLKTH